jgi:hypothetical protein
MLRRCLALLLVLGLTSPAFADTIRESATAVAKASALHPTGSPARGPMPKGLLWTGVGLLGAGGLTILLGSVIKNNDCGLSFDDCNALGTGYYILGGAMAGTGAALLIAAHAKREHLPTVMLTRHGGLGLQKRFTF